MHSNLVARLAIVCLEPSQQPWRETVSLHNHPNGVRSKRMIKLHAKNRNNIHWLQARERAPLWVARSPTTGCLLVNQLKGRAARPTVQRVPSGPGRPGAYRTVPASPAIHQTVFTEARAHDWRQLNKYVQTPRLPSGGRGGVSGNATPPAKILRSQLQYFRRLDIVQRARTNEFNAADALEAEPEGSVDNKAAQTAVIEDHQWTLTFFMQ